MSKPHFYSKINKGFGAILILLVVLAIGVIGYLGFKNYSSQKSQNDRILVPPTDPTADWKTYNGVIFEIRYPANFDMDNNDFGGPNIYLQTINLNECKSGGCNLGYKPLNIK